MTDYYFHPTDIELPEDIKEEISKSIAKLVSHNVQNFIDQVVNEPWASFDEDGKAGEFKVYIDTDREFYIPLTLQTMVDIAVNCNNTKRHHIGLAEEFERLAKLLRDADHPH